MFFHFMIGGERKLFLKKKGFGCMTIIVSYRNPVLFVMTKRGSATA